MSKFHINPKTGNVSACHASLRCPFGDLKEDHYSTSEEARDAYEEKMNPTPPPALHEIDIPDKISPTAKQLSKQGVTVLQLAPSNSINALDSTWTNQKFYNSEMEKYRGRVEVISDDSLMRKNISHRILLQDLSAQEEEEVVSTFHSMGKKRSGVH
jgi:hypothetical protein